jgi:RNA polymerase sigma-70 factor (ECF subfamily)
MKRRESQHVVRPEKEADAETGAPSAEEQLQLGSMSKHLAYCLGQLSLEVREAVVLRFMQQMSYQEMANVMGQRAATLQMRVARAMAVLRQCLQACGVSP